MFKVLSVLYNFIVYLHLKVYGKFSFNSKVHETKFLYLIYN